AATLDPRRLATPRMAAPPGARPRRTPRAQSVVDAVAMEARRQPAAQPGAPGARAAAAARMERAVAGVAVDRDRSRDPARAGHRHVDVRSRAQAARDDPRAARRVRGAQRV